MKDIEAIKALRIMDGHTRDWRAIKRLRLVESDFDDWGCAHKESSACYGTQTQDWEVKDVYPRWTCWAREIPALNVDSSWSVHMRAHTPGSLVRFRVYRGGSYLWEVLVCDNEMHAFNPSDEGEDYLSKLNAKKICAKMPEGAFLGNMVNSEINSSDERKRIEKFLPRLNLGKFSSNWEVEILISTLKNPVSFVITSESRRNRYGRPKSCHVMLEFMTDVRSENSACWVVYANCYDYGDQPHIPINNVEELMDTIKTILDPDDEY